MSELIRLGCAVADVYHRYHEIHGAVFGASYVRRMIDALRGQREDTYKKFIHDLQSQREELIRLEAQIADPRQQTPVTGADRELRRALLEYTGALIDAVGRLGKICIQVGQDEAGYREPGDDGRSPFTRDKLDYDQLLSELERVGTRLEKLFSNY